MKHVLPPLPYSPSALEPYISAETLEYHHAVHHDSYIRKLNEVVSHTRYAGMSLDEIVSRAPPGPISNNATQAWNHAFYWHSMSPSGGGNPGRKLGIAIDQWFGSFDCFKRSFEKACLNLVGSGWAWLVLEPDDRLAIHALKHASNNPISAGQQPLLVCDLWEHAYYLDHRSQRTRYLRSFWELVNWDFATANFSQPRHLRRMRTLQYDKAMAPYRQPAYCGGNAATQAA